MLKAILSIGTVQALIMLVNLGRTKSLALLLGPEWVGVMAVADRLLAVVAQTASLSLPYAAIRFLPELWEREPHEFASLLRRMRNLLAVMALAGMLFGLLVTLVAPGAWGEELRPYRSIVFSGFLSLPVLMFVPFLENAIAARLQPNGAMLFALLHAGVFTTAAVIGVIWAGLSGLYVCYAILGLFLVLAMVRRLDQPQAPTSRASPRADRLTLPRRIWKFSLTFVALTFAIPAAALYVYYEVLTKYGVAAAGTMAAAMGIAFFLRNLLGRANAVFMTPSVNRGGSPEQRMAWLDQYQRTFSFVCVLAVTPVLLFPHLIIALVFSREFLPAAPFVALFVVAEVILLLAGAFQGLVVALDHLGYHVAQNLVAQSILVGVAALLIGPFGIFGAGVAVLTAPVILYGGSMHFLRRRYRLRISRRSALLTAYLVASLAAAGWLGATHGELSAVVLAGKALTFCTVVAGLASFLTSADHAKLQRVVGGLRSPRLRARRRQAHAAAPAEEGGP